MRGTLDYLSLIAPEHSDKPKFTATVALTVDVLARFQVFLAGLPQAFDLDFAIGVQLDAVGIRVGRSRDVPYPLQGLYFSFDKPGRGWDQGVWKGPYDTGLGIYRLDDDTFRRLLRAKILTNTWDGTIAGEEAINAAYFVDPATRVFISDDATSPQAENYFSFDDPARGWDEGIWAPSALALGAQPSTDMRMTVGIAGRIPNIVDLAVMNEGLIGAKPEGVTVDYAITSVNNAPVFGFDIENQYISGWDVGAWGVSPAYLMANTP